MKTHSSQPNGLVWWLGAVAAAALLTVCVKAQEAWKADYDRGVRAFDNGDFATAEQRMLKVLDEAPAKQVRSETVDIQSQMRGFIPEYYLAMLYATQQKWAEVEHYGKIAEKYLKPGAKLTSLQNAEVEATKALASPPPNSTSDNTGHAPVGPDSTPPELQAIRTALAAGHIAEARQLRDRARQTGAGGQAFDAVSHDVDRAEFDEDVHEARQALAQGQLVAARTAAGRARNLNVDSTQVDALDADINRAEAASALSAAQSALTEHRYADATSGASRVKQLGGDATAADQILRKAADGVAFETWLSKANAALARNGFVDARDDAKQAHDLNVDNDRADALGAKIDSAERAMTARLSTDARQRLGMRDFFLGDYAGAVNVLTPIATQTPRAALYLASAYAALSIVEPNLAKRAQLEASAHEKWAQAAGQRASFSQDLAYLSPAVAKVLGISR